jgi:hypothetical protein
VITSIVPERLLLFLSKVYYIGANEYGWDHAREIVFEHHEHMEAFHRAYELSYIADEVVVDKSDHMKLPHQRSEVHEQHLTSPPPR